MAAEYDLILLNKN